MLVTGEAVTGTQQPPINVQPLGRPADPRHSDCLIFESLGCCLLIVQLFLLLNKLP